MHLVLCLLEISVLAGLSVVDGQLRVGVPQASLPIARKALRQTHGEDNVTLLPIASGSVGSSLDKINQTFQEISNLDLDALLGPFDVALDLIAESLSIPYLCTTHDSSLVRKPTTFEMLPDTQWTGWAVLDIIKAYGWAQVAVFHDDYTGVPLVEQMVTNRSVLVRAWRLSKDADRNHINQVLVELRKLRIQSVLVFCSRRITRLMLEESRDLAILSTPPYHWMFYDPGLESRKVLSAYDQIHVNFTVVSLVEFNDTFKSGSHSRIEFALTSDALKILSVASNRLLPLNSEINATSSALANAIKKAKASGHTGLLEFDSQGHRVGMALGLTTISGIRSYPRGIWNSHPQAQEPNLNLNTAVFPVNISRPFPLIGRKVKVVLILNMPFTMFKKDHKDRTGNDRFEGFSVDLIELVAKELKFDYELYLVHDGKFGSRLPNGQWNGVVGELVVGNATMSVAPLSINADRESAADFTKPFLTRHITVLMRIPTYQTSYFQFLSPFSPLVWAITLVAFAIVSCILYGLEKIGRSVDRQALADLPEVTIREACWFIFGSLVQGNTDPMASSLPGRILTSAWWFFALILTSSYTANLAAFLTAKKIATPINSVTDLAQQTKIKYGTIQDTGVMNFFENTQIDYFKRMWEQMSKIDPDSMVDTEEDAIHKVKNEDYAFFWDSSVNKYRAQTDCDLMEIGPAFDPKGFGIGVPPGASYLDQLSMTILKLSDSGQLEYLQSKWWDVNKCPDLSGGADETSSLQLENVAGVFFIVVGGIALACLVCLVQWNCPGLFRLPKFVFGEVSPKKVKTSEDDGVDAERL